MIYRVFSLTFSMAIVLLSAPPAHATDQYFLLMFGSQRTPVNPNYSHTFATFVKVKSAPQASISETHTVSWLPANMKVRIGALLPEPGHNFDLHTTLAMANATQQRVSLWGPYPIHPEAYDRALLRIRELESGTVKYKANDMLRRDQRVANCIHAVSAIPNGPRLVVVSPGWGESASFFVLQEFEPWLLSKQPVPWVGSALGLDDYPIIYREYRNPRSNAVIGPFYRALGGERDLRATFGPPSYR